VALSAVVPLAATMRKLRPRAGSTPSGGGPLEAVAAGGLCAQLDGVDHVAAGVEDLDLHPRRRRWRVSKPPCTHDPRRWRSGGCPRSDDVAADQGRALHRLQLHELACSGPSTVRVELLDAVDGVDLRHLAGDLRVVHRVERVLVLHLRHQQLEEAVLGAGLVGGGARRPRPLRRRKEVAKSTVVGMGFQGGLSWPICSVFCSRLRAVLMTSTLFWYEREAEIMFTISSTGFTLL
jgi:hypothetical protein